jgi:hypothetical protein
MIDLFRNESSPIEVSYTQTMSTVMSRLCLSALCMGIPTACKKAWRLENGLFVKVEGLVRMGIRAQVPTNYRGNPWVLYGQCDVGRTGRMQTVWAPHRRLSV